MTQTNSDSRAVRADGRLRPLFLKMHQQHPSIFKKTKRQK
jgi:hypothetical protein